MTTAMAKVAKPIDSLRALFDKATPAIAQVIPAHLTPERILRVTLACVSRTPLLLECTPQSILQGVMLASQLGLDPTGGTLGQGYLVPYRNNKTGKREAQFIPGYRGLIDLARRSGNVDSIHAHPVFQKDRFTYQLGSNPGIDHVPALTDDPGPLVAAYMVAFLKDSAIPQIEIMSREQIDSIRKRSKAKDAGPWVTDFDEMARKTVVRRGAKYLPMSVEFATGLELQDAAERGEPVDYSTLDIEMPALPADESEPAAPPQTRTQSVKEKLKAAPPAPVDVPQVVDAEEVDDEYEPTESLPWEEAPLAVEPEPERSTKAEPAPVVEMLSKVGLDLIKKGLANLTPVQRDEFFEAFQISKVSSLQKDQWQTAMIWIDKRTIHDEKDEDPESAPIVQQDDEVEAAVEAGEIITDEQVAALVDFAESKGLTGEQLDVVRGWLEVPSIPDLPPSLFDRAMRLVAIIAKLKDPGRMQTALKHYGAASVLALTDENLNQMLAKLAGGGR